MTTVTPLDVFRCPLQGLQLVEASAGTGKTWAICGLVLRLLIERELEVQQLLVVTFTNAATAELRERVRSRIAQTLACLRQGDASGDVFVDTLLATQRAAGRSDEQMKRLLERALQTFDEASIFTIHGLCQRALAEAAFSAGLPMTLQPLTDASALELQVVQDFWRREVATPQLTPALAAWLTRQQDSPERWREVLRKRLARPLARLRWPDEATAPTAAADATALQQAFDAARRCWQAERDEIVAIVEEARPRLNQTRYKAAALADAFVAWDQWLQPAVLDIGIAPPKKLDLLAQGKMKPTGRQAGAAPHRFFALAQTLLDTRDTFEQALEGQRLKLLRRLVEQGPAWLAQAQTAARVIGFDAMLSQLHERLHGAGGDRLAARLHERFPVVLIDEFQDTDPLQFAIFERFCAGGTLFLVGDPKQAIYSFRSADLHVYLRARQQAARRFTLVDNQRSARALLQGLNALFGVHPRPFLDEHIAYVAVNFGDKPRPALDDRSAPRAALQVWQLPPDADGQPLKKTLALQLALQATAGEIARLLSAAQAGEVRYAGRALQGGDIAVLVRTHRQGAAMRQALTALGVGSVELSQAHLHGSSEALELEVVLSAIAEPQREGLLRAALATELMGADATAIEALTADDNALQRCMQDFARHHRRWREQGVAAMLRRWLHDDGVAARLLARTDGERRMTNLLHLVERLQQAEAMHAAPEALLRWLRQQRLDPDADDTAQLRLESDRELVQIVTIHRAKGLEYPLVFCPTLFEGVAAPPKSSAPGRTLHDETGQAWIDFTATRDNADSARAVAEHAAEGLRLAYVALTRAVHRCTVVMGGYVASNSSKAAGRSPMAWWVAGAGLSAQNWLDGAISSAAAERGWQRLAQAHPEAIGIAPLPLQAGTPLTLPRPAAASLQARPAPARIDPGWRIASYTGLVQGLQHEQAALDHDQHLPATSDAEPVALDDDVLHFPRGPEAGVCLHTVFEHADFDDPSTWPTAISTALQRTPLASPRPLAPMLERALGDVLATPIAPGLRLADVPRRQRLPELEFNLPVHRLDSAALQAALRSLGQPWVLPPLPALHGYLRGYVDLVFEHQGRYHLLDWKSNHLGDQPADYAAGSLQRAMQQHGYALQGLLYALALHRLLQARLPGYRAELHLGAVHFLFVRGVRPQWPAGSGVVSLQPGAEVLQRLSRSFMEIDR